MKRTVLFLLLLGVFGIVRTQQVPKKHVVKQHEVASKIAPMYGINLVQMQEYNPGMVLDRINPGDVLIVGYEEESVVDEANAANKTEQKKEGEHKRGQKRDKGPVFPDKERESSSGFLTWLLWIIIISAVGYGCYYWWPNLRDGLFKLRGRPSSFENEMREVSSGEVAALRKRVRELEDEVQRLKSEKRQLDRERKELLEENIQLGEQVEAKNDSQKEKVSQPKPVAEPQRANRIKYAESIMGDTLILVSDIPSPDALFRLELEDGRTAKFELHEPAIRRVVSNPSFLEGCDKQVVGRSKVTVVEPGEARKDENGYWHVTKKLKVVIE